MSVPQSRSGKMADQESDMEYSSDNDEFEDYYNSGEWKTFLSPCCLTEIISKTHVYTAAGEWSKAYGGFCVSSFVSDDGHGPWDTAVSPD